MPRPPRWSVLAVLVVAAVMVAALLAMGRVPWCPQGDLALVSFDTWSPHNSQHLLDAYSFSHFQHGLVFFAVIGFGWPRRAVAARVVLATALEGAWEILENTPMVIEHYRNTTVSLDYTGDSVANSLSDLACCLAGYLVALRLPLWATLTVFVVIEAAMVATLRDSLLLNVLMLVAPVEAVRVWQLGG